MSERNRTIRTTGLVCTLALLAGCNDTFNNLDLDLRNNAPGGLDTSSAARLASADRPRPDGNGLITYPNYQVAVARRGDTVNSVAQRIGIGGAELAAFNGLRPEDPLNQDAVLA
ncbi:MAG: peptidase M23, partial [Jannaschia sp.]